MPTFQNVLMHKYYFDELYAAVFVRPMDAIAGIGLREIEQPLIDGALDATGEAAEAGATTLSLTQSGYFRNYVLVFVAGAVIAVVLLLVRSG
jgi:NADH-quinone oxidoreductase subunit L